MKGTRLTKRFAALLCALASAFAVVPGASVQAQAALVGGAAIDEGQLTIEGRLDGRRDKVDLSAVTVAVNGVAAPVAADGSFSASVARTAYYRLDITGAGIFTMVQTFGNEEVSDGGCGCLALPAIELVARKAGRVELFFGGDSMAGRRYFEAGPGKKAVLDRVTIERDLDRLLAPMAPYFSTSDLASVNLESVVAAEQPGPPAPKKYKFFSPVELPQAMVRAGIDHVSLGNNHTNDYGDPGMRTTLAAIEAAGLATSGAGMNVEQAERASRFTIGGTKIALYGFVGWRGDWDPNQTATETKGGAAWGTLDRVTAVTIRERRAGYLPIMEFHGNVEYGDRPTEMSLPRFRTAVDKGAPVVIGHHPHVTQGLEIYRGALIAHSLGNFMFDQDHPHTQNTYGLKVWLQNGKFLRAEVIPMQVLDYRPVPAVGGMREAVLRRVHWLSAELGTMLARSGGHAVVWAKGPKAVQPACRTPGEERLAAIAPACLDPKMDYGRNIVPRGDFANTLVAEARERFWETRNASVDFRGLDGGHGAMVLLPEGAAKPFYLYTKSYLRDLYALRFSLTSKVRTARPVEVRLLVKARPGEDDEMTPSVAGEEIGRQVIQPGGDWQELRFDFARPQVKQGAIPGVTGAVPDPFRFILAFRYLDTRGEGDKAMAFDDFALVEWADAPSQADPAQAWRWTHARTRALAAEQNGAGHASGR